MSASFYGGTPNNGRIDLTGFLKKVPILNYMQEPVNNCKFNERALEGQLQRTPLSDLFFSAMNIDALQLGIKNRVANETEGKYIIGRQSDAELKIVMRSVFLQYAKHQPDRIVEQVRELNKLVLDFSANQVLSNLRQYIIYKKDASTLPLPIEWGVNPSVKGTKNLELKRFI
jgi:hypothetical protein